MPLRSKVKTRIRTLLGGAVALACVGLASGDKAGKAPLPGIGERAVAAPRPPVLVPPILDKAAARNSLIRVDLKAQRLILLVAGEVAIDSPISSGRKDLETPTGKFHVEKKVPRQKQGDYGNLVDPSGKVVVAGVYRNRDPVPRGLRFQPVDIDHIIAVNGQTFRFHAGAVGGLPVSDGSIILPDEVARVLSMKVHAGCPIEIVAE